jgi:hypothetical protein
MAVVREADLAFRAAIAAEYKERGLRRSLDEIIPSVDEVQMILSQEGSTERDPICLDVLRLTEVVHRDEESERTSLITIVGRILYEKRFEKQSSVPREWKSV